MRRHQPGALPAKHEEAAGEDQPGDLLPEDAQANLRPEGPAGAGGRGRHLDERPQGQGPDEQGDGAREPRRVGRSRGKEQGDPVGIERHEQGDESRRQDGDKQGELDRAMDVHLGLAGRHDPLQGAGHRQVENVGEQADGAPQDDIDAVSGKTEHPDVERLGDGLDQRAGARQAGQAGAARHLAAGDGGRAGQVVAHSSVRISTASPTRRKRRNGPQAARKGG